MHLKRLVVKNFRALEDIEVEFNHRINVIVGPNAIGKTTVLEAIKIAKAVLAARTGNEASQSLMALGAVVPHNQQLIADALARDTTKPVRIDCDYELTQDEISKLRTSKAQIVTTLIQSRLSAVNPASFAAFVSSPAGQQALEAGNVEVSTALDRLSSSRTCPVNLEINFAQGLIQTKEPIFPVLFSFLEKMLSPDLAYFSYFPADRARPRGEQGIQIGIQDALQQIEAHNSQPQIKYARLKNMIFNAVISGEQSRISLKDDFRKIFSGILKGRELSDDGIGVNEHGQLRIMVREVETGRVFDIDAMSSGEKGLILTFLSISRTLASGGIVLLDEPELHLNPAVCKDLIAFILDGYADRKDLQLIICSHSPEILAGAFTRDDCSLFHLVSGTNLTKVRRHDQEELNEALRRLGTSESEGLLYKGTIFVEGVQDVDLIEAGFGDLLRQYKLKELGGRNEVERHIRALQDAEKIGEDVSPRFFIFDRDECPSNLKSSSAVKVLQWDRRCLENYLIDVYVITDLLKDKDITREPVSNVGEVARALRELAMSQIDEYAAREAFNVKSYENFTLRSDDINKKSPTDIADALVARLEAAKSSIGTLDSESWKSDFLHTFNRRKKEVADVWDIKWREDCDGKRLFADLRAHFQLKISIDRFKRRVMQNMKAGPSESWRSIESLLKGLVGNGS